jgi:chromosomal replication initiation ATPase DnaA
VNADGRPKAAAPARQLALDLPVETRLGVEDFLVGVSNEQAYGLIERWPDWADPVLLLWGPEGSGKSHLAAIWAERAHAWTVPASALTTARVPELIAQGALVIEDCDRPGRDDSAMFHLLNAVRAKTGATQNGSAQASLLLTSRLPLDEWGVGVPDALSRLRLAPEVSIGMPDDALLRAVLVKQFLDRQLIVDTALVEALVTHMHRSFAQAQRLVDALDRLSLERRKRLTRALAFEVLEQLDAAE